MNLIDGIGGAFLFSNSPKELAAWYETALGLVPSGRNEEDGSVYKMYEYRDLEDSTVKKSTTWAILPAKQNLKGQPRTGQINYRVKSMEAMLAHLAAKSIAIEETQTFDYGKFAWLNDPDGNRIELFEDL